MPVDHSARDDALWRKRLGTRVVLLEDGRSVPGRLVRVEGSPPAYVWVDWDSPLGHHRPYRLRWPDPRLGFPDEVSDDYDY